MRAALSQVSDYRLLGASSFWYIAICCFSIKQTLFRTHCITWQFLIERVHVSPVPHPRGCAEKLCGLSLRNLHLYPHCITWQALIEGVSPVPHPRDVLRSSVGWALETFRCTRIVLYMKIKRCRIQYKFFVFFSCNLEQANYIINSVLIYFKEGLQATLHMLSTYLTVYTHNCTKNVFRKGNNYHYYYFTK